MINCCKPCSHRCRRVFIRGRTAALECTVGTVIACSARNSSKTPPSLL